MDQQGNKPYRGKRAGALARQARSQANVANFVTRLANASSGQFNQGQQNSKKSKNTKNGSCIQSLPIANYDSNHVQPTVNDQGMEKVAPAANYYQPSISGQASNAGFYLPVVHDQDGIQYFSPNGSNYYRLFGAQGSQLGDQIYYNYEAQLAQGVGQNGPPEQVLPPAADSNIRQLPQPIYPQAGQGAGIQGLDRGLGAGQNIGLPLPTDGQASAAAGIHASRQPVQVVSQNVVGPQRQVFPPNAAIYIGQLPPQANVPAGALPGADINMRQLPRQENQRGVGMQHQALNEELGAGQDMRPPLPADGQARAGAGILANAQVPNNAAQPVQGVSGPSRQVFPPNATIYIGQLPPQSYLQAGTGVGVHANGNVLYNVAQPVQAVGQNVGGPPRQVFLPNAALNIRQLPPQAYPQAGAGAGIVANGPAPNNGGGGQNVGGPPGLVVPPGALPGAEMNIGQLPPQANSQAGQGAGIGAGQNMEPQLPANGQAEAGTGIVANGPAPNNGGGQNVGGPPRQVFLPGAAINMGQLPQHACLQAGAGAGILTNGNGLYNVAQLVRGVDQNFYVVPQAQISPPHGAIKQLPPQAYLQVGARANIVTNGQALHNAAQLVLGGGQNVRGPPGLVVPPGALPRAEMNIGQQPPQANPQVGQGAGIGAGQNMGPQLPANGQAEAGAGIVANGPAPNNGGGQNVRGPPGLVVPPGALPGAEINIGQLPPQAYLEAGQVAGMHGLGGGLGAGQNIGPPLPADEQASVAAGYLASGQPIQVVSQNVVGPRQVFPPNAAIYIGQLPPQAYPQAGAGAGIVANGPAPNNGGGGQNVGGPPGLVVPPGALPRAEMNIGQQPPQANPQAGQGAGIGAGQNMGLQLPANGQAEAGAGIVANGPAPNNGGGGQNVRGPPGLVVPPGALPGAEMNIGQQPPQANPQAGQGAGIGAGQNMGPQLPANGQAEAGAGIVASGPAPNNGGGGQNVGGPPGLVVPPGALPRAEMNIGQLPQQANLQAGQGAGIQELDRGLGVGQNMGPPPAAYGQAEAPLPPPGTAGAGNSN